MIYKKNIKKIINILYNYAYYIFKSSYIIYINNTCIN